MTPREQFRRKHGNAACWVTDWALYGARNGNLVMEGHIFLLECVSSYEEELLTVAVGDGVIERTVWHDKCRLTQKGKQLLAEYLLLID